MTDRLLGSVEAAAGVAVYGWAAVDSTGARSTRDALVAAGVPALLAGKDPALWPAGTRPRLGWLDAFRTGRELLPQLAELRAELADLDRVVLAATGGPALAAEAIARSARRGLTLLDSTDPHQVRTVLAGDMRRTLAVVAAGPETALDADAHLRVLHQAFTDAGLTAAESGRHLVVVTDPASPVDKLARDLGAYVIGADPDVCSRFGALNAYGVVPAALAGVDVADLLEQAEALAPELAEASGNPGLALGAALAAAALAGRDTVALVPDGSGLDGITDWIEQLIAGSTGTDGMGLLPVAGEHPGVPGVSGAGVLTVSVGTGPGPAGVVTGAAAPDVAVDGPLGAQFLTWEYATAVLARVLGVDPFVEPAADDTEHLLSGAPTPAPAFVAGAVEVHTTSGAGDLVGVLRDATAVGGGYLAVSAYLDRHADAALAGLQAQLAAAAGRPVSFGWAPRSRAADRRLHLDGPPVGRHVQITGAAPLDVPVPGRSYTLGQLHAAYAAADRRALTGRGRPPLHLHLTDRATGIRQLLDAAAALRP